MPFSHQVMTEMTELYVYMVCLVVLERRRSNINLEPALMATFLMFRLRTYLILRTL